MSFSTNVLSPQLNTPQSKEYLLEENKKLRQDISKLKSELLKHIPFSDLNKLLERNDTPSNPNSVSSKVKLTIPVGESHVSSSNSASISNISPAVTKELDTENDVAIKLKENQNIAGNGNNTNIAIKSTESPKEGVPVSKKLSISPSSFGLSQIIGSAGERSEPNSAKTNRAISVAPPRSSNRNTNNNDSVDAEGSNLFDFNASDNSLVEATIEEDEDINSKYDPLDNESKKSDGFEDDDFNLSSITNKNTKRSVQMKGLDEFNSMSPTSAPRSIKSPRLLSSELNTDFDYNYNMTNNNNVSSLISESAGSANIISQILDVPDLQHETPVSSQIDPYLVTESDKLARSEINQNIGFLDETIKPPKSPLPAVKTPVNGTHFDKRESAVSMNSLSSSIQLSPSPSILATPRLSPSPQLLKTLSPVLKPDNDENNKPATSTTYTTSRIQIKHQPSITDVSNLSTGANKSKVTQQTPTKIKILDDFDMNYVDVQSQRSSMYNQQLNNNAYSPRSQVLQSPRSLSKNRHNVIYDNKLHSPMRMEPLDISEIEEELKSFSDLENTNLNLDISLEKDAKHNVSHSLAPEKPAKNASLFVQPNELKNIDIKLISCIHFLEEQHELGFLFEVVDRGSGKKLYEFSKKYDQVQRLLLQFQKFTDMSMDIPSHQSDDDNSPPLKIITRHINIDNILKHALNFSIDSNNLSLLIKLAEFISTNISINHFGKVSYHFDKLFPEESIKYENYCLLKRYKTIGTSSSWKYRCIALVDFENNYYLKFLDLNKNTTEGLKISSNTILEFYDNNEQELEKYGCHNGFYISENGKKTGISNSKNNNKFYISFEKKKIRDEWIKKIYQIVKTSTLLPDSAHHQSYSEISSMQSEELTDASSTTSMSRSELKRSRMRSLFPFKPKEQHLPSSQMNSSSEHLPNQTINETQSISDTDEFEDNGLVFGNSLHFTLLKSQSDFESFAIPTVVHNCLQRLYKHKDQLDEEGIFRISGSSLAIKNLIEKFNKVYDVSLADADIHVVTGLLKTYLRLLPDAGGVLGFDREHSLDEFKKVTDLELPVLAVLEKFKTLLWNRAVVDNEHFGLCFVIFELLWKISERSSLNKMNLRNLVIVFAPTLDIPVEILTHFIRDFNYLFKQEVSLDQKVKRENLQLSIPGI